MVYCLAMANPHGLTQRTLNPPSVGNSFRNSGLEQFGELLGNYRTAEIVSLRLVTLARLKKGQLPLLFHALGNYPQLQTSSHADRCGHDGRLIGSGSDLADERLVDL